MSQIQTDRIVSKPEVCGGKPCIAGTRIRVQDIYVWHELQGSSADEIVSRYPQISMADVYAALAFFWEHHEELRGQMATETAIVEAIQQRHPSRLKP